MSYLKENKFLKIIIIIMLLPITFVMLSIIIDSILLFGRLVGTAIRDLLSN